VTLFFLVIDTESKEIAWVRAGHDSALLYDHASDSFEEIGGAGIALGVDGQYMYREQRRSRLSKGQILLLGTDGIWEASDPQGKRFGKEAVFAGVRSHRQKSAGEIIDVVLDAQAAFQKGSKMEDDATLVILKIQP
jgi:sigma-B regulation protein RsbU (phosphoserine phosphatase)